MEHFCKLNITNSGTIQVTSSSNKMAFKFVAILATLALANAGYIEQPAVHYQGLGSYSDGHLAVGHSSQDILRTHGGTVSQISKQVLSPHSSVSKSVTSVSNDGYKTLGYAHQPATYAYSHEPATYAYAHQPAIAYSHQPAIAKTVSTYAAPAVHYAAQPALAKTIQYNAPTVAYHQPAAVQYTQYAAPALAKTVSYAAPAVAKTISYAAPAVAKAVYAEPAVSGYATKTLSYSPAAQVSHFSFESPVAHYAW